MFGFLAMVRFLASCARSPWRLVAAIVAALWLYAIGRELAAAAPSLRPDLERKAVVLAGGGCR